MRTSWTALLVMLVGCSLLLIACQQKEAQDDLPADALFEEANELARRGNFVEAERLAEIAGEKGSLCAIQLLAEITHPNIRAFGYSRELTLPAVDWSGQSEERSRYWTQRLMDGLHREAELGNAVAMNMLSWAYRPTNYSDDWMGYVEGDSAASIDWLKRAVELGSAASRFYYALRIGPRSEEGKAILREAALQGDGRAFSMWASVNLEYTDPRAFFEIGSLAIDLEAPGVHDWLGKALEEMEKQIEKGNEGAVEWMAIADSLGLRERLADLPESPLPTYQKMMLCPESLGWRFPQTNPAAE